MSDANQFKATDGFKIHYQRNSTVNSNSIQWLTDAEDRGSSYRETQKFKSKPTFI